MTKSPAEVAALFGCTEAQARAQMERNAKQLRDCETCAEQSKGGTYRGFTADEWAARAAAVEKALTGFATLAEIQEAVRAGKRVHWKNTRYTIGRWLTRGGTEEWLVVCDGGSSVKLFHADGIGSDHVAADFFIGE